MLDKEINILGAGLCGSLLSIMMAKQGYSVTVREKRSDPRKNRGSAGRSINLAMSAKGINALKYAGIFEQIEPLLMPMKGRMLHFQDGREELQPYGQYDHEFIYSVSRLRLNHLLIDAAEEIGVEIKFQHSVESFDKEKNVSFQSNNGGYKLTAKNLLVTDGAGSMMRRSYNGSSPILPQEEILPHIKNKIDQKFYEIIHTEKFVKSTDSPLEAAKKGKDTSMWLSINSVKNKNSDIVISAGNTGALLVIAKLNLKMIESIDKPALSALWPNKKGMSVVLDLGANIECSSKNLLDFSIMGASLYKSLYPNDNPNVALLNIGSEELKGNEIIKETFQILNELKSENFNFSGYIEGNQLMNGDVNVIVADGFTGNVALKTAEGTANFIIEELKKTLGGTIIGKISSILNISNLRKFKKRLDPRLYNGAIFIGLDSPVVKSHGGTDYIGFSNSLEVCNRIIKGNLIDKIKNNIS